jgi:hypothetical protein
MGTASIPGHSKVTADVFIIPRFGAAVQIRLPAARAAQA